MSQTLTPRPEAAPAKPETGNRAKPRVDELDVLDVARVALGTGGFVVPDEVRQRLAAARAVVDDVVTRGLPAYGVTRGLGPLRDQEIPPHRQAEFQTWTLLTHAAGVGEPMTRAEARATLAARLAGMAQGGSGISPAAFDALHALLTSDVTPWLPAEGSVGAADLAQLAAAGLVVVGRGRVLAADGRTGLPAAVALQEAGLAPVELGPKDALAIIGANSASVGLACLAVHRLATLQPAADLAAAAALETLGGNPGAWSAPVVAARAHPGQQVSGDRLRLALRGGDLAAGTSAPGPGTCPGSPCPAATGNGTGTSPPCSPARSTPATTCCGTSRCAPAGSSPRPVTPSS